MVVLVAKWQCTGCREVKALRHGPMPRTALLDAATLPSKLTASSCEECGSPRRLQHPANRAVVAEA